MRWLDPACCSPHPPTRRTGGVSERDPHTRPAMAHARSTAGNKENSVQIMEDTKLFTAVPLSTADPERTAQVDATGAFLCAGEARPMSHAEQYEFDRLGYLVMRGFMSAEEVASLRAATNRLEAHANSMISPDPGGEHAPPHKLSPWGPTMYHFDPELGYHVRVSRVCASARCSLICACPRRRPTTSAAAGWRSMATATARSSKITSTPVRRPTTWTTTRHYGPNHLGF